MLFGGIAGIVTVRKGERLTVFLQAGFAVFVVNALVVITFALLGNQDALACSSSWATSAVAAGGAAIATVGSFAVIGSVFGILTSFQLLELANPSQPLLRRLLVETPGTYHHSLMVGNLAERAAEAIGGDPLLARVAAYYHDIGKLSNPAAFIENQAGGGNLHDELDPETSAALLKSHVSAGIDIAYKSGLPKALIAFIPQHHGTAVMSYFYARAKEQAAEPYGGLQTADGRKAADAVDIRKFRHGGPKPQTREAAIIMLADSTEASVRSLDLARRGGDPGDGRADHRGAHRRRPVRRVRPDAPRHRADPRGVRGAAAGHVPPADRVPAEQGRGARVEARLRGVAATPAPRTTSAARARSGDNASVATPDPHKNMVHVPGGTFRMGSEEFYPEERPVHTVSVDDFWIDEHPVTVADYRRFVKATGYLTFAERPLDPAAYPGADPDLLVPGSLVFRQTSGPVPLDNYLQWWSFVPGASWRQPEGPASTIVGRDRHPVTQVNYEDAVAYATWVGKTLPTEAEWEFAARGGLDGKRFTWGDEETPRGKRMANTWQGEFPWRNSLEDGFLGTSPVKSFPHNGFGLYDMAGNVWEWTSDFYVDRHPTRSPTRAARPTTRGWSRRSASRATAPRSRAGSRRAAPTCARPATASGIDRRPARGRPSTPARATWASAAWRGEQPLPRSVAGRRGVARRRPAAAAVRGPCADGRRGPRRRRCPRSRVHRPDPRRRRRARHLNATHMGKDGPTDVLSFPLLPPSAYPPHLGQPPGVRSTNGGVAFALPPDARPHLGDVIVSVERAVEQAEAGRGGQTGDVRWDARDELRLLVTHGTLHVCGWDHAEPAEESAMRALEQRLLR